MIVNILDYVTRCYTQEDGEIIANVIDSALKRGDDVVVSFSGVYSAPSSFINSAFIKLLDDFTFADIRARVTFVHSTKQINELIKKRFDFEVNKRHALEYA